MTFADAVRSVLTQYVTFTGRARRAEYWWFYLFSLLVGFAASVVDSAIGIDAVGTITSLALLLPTLAVTVRRLHDTGRSAWWLLAMVGPVLTGAVLLVAGFVTALGGGEGFSAMVGVGALLVLAGVVLSIVLMCLPGTPGLNQYGPSPLGPLPGSQDPYGGPPAAPYGQQPSGHPGDTQPFPQPFPQHPTVPPSGPDTSGGPRPTA